MVYAVGTGSAIPDQYQNANTFLAYAALILGGAARVLGPVVGAIILLFILQFADTGLRALISNGVIPDALLSSDRRRPDPLRAGRRRAHAAAGLPTAGHLR